MEDSNNNNKAPLEMWINKIRLVVGQLMSVGVGARVRKMGQKDEAEKGREGAAQ